MNFRFALVVAWIAATAASIVVGFAAVGSVRTVISAPGSLQVPSINASIDSPESVIQANHETSTSVATTVTTIPPPTTSPPTTVRAEPETSVTAAPTPAQTTTSSNSTTTTRPTTTTTTAPSNPGVSDPYEVDGGWVTISSDGSAVHLESASPKPGWTVTVENSGPDEVVVVFKSKEEETHFVAKLSQGQVKIQIED